MPEDEYDIDALERYGDADPPVIDTLIKSWIDQLDFVYSLIQTTGLRYKLESAEGSDLDDIWGRIFHIKRFANESDEDYRSRLIVHTKILMGSGTVHACESIIDSLLDEPGATVIETRWPGMVHVGFRDIESLRLAKKSEIKIKKILPQALAAGMNYEMILPIAEYDLSLIIKALSHKDYDIRAHLQKEAWADYDISAKIAFSNSETYDISAYFLKHRDKIYQLLCGQLVVPRTRNYTIDSRLKRAYSISYNIDARLKNDKRIKQYRADARLQKVMSSLYTLASRIQRNRKYFYGLAATVEAF